jgi:hypothetical protein
MDRRLAYENRWDLLDVNSASRALIESAVDTQETNKNLK